MSEAPKRTPRLITSGRDAKSFPLSPTDGFVLSRVDGTMDEDDLSESTGVPKAQTLASLAKLETLGLISFDGPPGPTPPRRIRQTTASQTPQTTATPEPSPLHETPVAGTPSREKSLGGPPQPRPVVSAQGPSADEEAGLVEEIDLDADLRRKIIEAHRALDQRDHYALLGVAETADRKTIKRAYYELAAAFHPDRYFRKRLGSFKVRMEAVFARLTIAHDTLATKESRSDYDAYISERRISRAIEEHLASGLAQAKQAEASVEKLVLAEVAQAAPPPPPPVVTSSPQVDLAARREALARRLMGGHASRPPISSPAVGATKPGGPTAAPGAPMQTADAVNALRRRYEDRMHRAKAREALKFVTEAEAALASGDSIAAANAFRIAANLDATDAELERRASQARVNADALLAETYTRQGRYEETQGQWAEAARSWARVCKVSPDNAIAHERAGNASVKAMVDLHAGVGFAVRACELDPKNALFRITLAICYSTAGMTLNARRELDTAAQLAPHDDTIQSMIKRVGQPA